MLRKPANLAVISVIAASIGGIALMGAAFAEPGKHKGGPGGPGGPRGPAAHAPAARPAPTPHVGRPAPMARPAPHFAAPRAAPPRPHMARPAPAPRAVHRAPPALRHAVTPRHAAPRHMTRGPDRARFVAPSRATPHMAAPRGRPGLVNDAERRDLRRMDRAERRAVPRERAAQQPTMARERLQQRQAERLQQRQNAAASRLERLQQRAERGRLGRGERRDLQRLERVQRQQVTPSTAARDQSPRTTRATRVTPQQVNQGRFASNFTASADPSWRRSDRGAERLAARAAWRLGLRASFVPWRGPVYWPHAYSDIFHYAFWPDAYEPSYWAYAYDDFYDGIFFPDGAPHVDYAYPGPYQTFTTRETSIRDSSPRARAVTPGRLSEATRAFCAEQARGVSAWPFDEIARAVQPINDQKELLADLRKAAAEAAAQLRDACPNAVPLTPVGRIEAMTMRFDAMLGAIKTVRPALVAFYESLTDEQKARFNELGPVLERQPRAATAQINCKDGKAGVTGLTLERIEAIVQPTGAQEGTLAPLRDAIDKSEQRLNAVCAAATPQTPVGRLDAMQQRIETLLAAANEIRPALEAFYASLDSEQKAKFNRLSRVAER